MTKIGTETITRTSHSVSIGPASSEAAVGNQSISSPRAMPPADAIAPIASSGSRWLRPDFSSPIGGTSYATRAAEGTPVGAQLRRVRQGAVGVGRLGAMPAAHTRAEGGGGESLVAAERLRELGGLAVAHA